MSLIVERFDVGPFEITFPQKVSKYWHMKVIAKGTNSVISLMKNLFTKKLVACKIINRKELTKNGTFHLFEKECRIMQQISHPNVIQLEDIIYTKDNIYLVMEYCNKGTLLDYVLKAGRIRDKEFRRLAVHLLNALQYLHQKSIVHHDIKLDNIVLDEIAIPKFIDFGLSYESSFQPIDTMVNGTQGYLAPEMNSQFGYDGKKADVWALGVCFFVMATGQMPTNTKRDSQILNIIPNDTKSFILRMLDYDPTTRPTAIDLYNEFLEICTRSPLSHSSPGVGCLKVSKSLGSVFPPRRLSADDDPKKKMRNKKRDSVLLFSGSTTSNLLLVK